MVGHAVNPVILEAEEGIVLPAWSTQQTPDQLRLHSEILSQKKLIDK